MWHQPIENTSICWPITIEQPHSEQQALRLAFITQLTVSTYRLAAGRLAQVRPRKRTCFMAYLAFRISTEEQRQSERVRLPAILDYHACGEFNASLPVLLRLLPYGGRYHCWAPPGLP